MIPPGYGLSDLALIIGIADRIYTTYKDSPGQFQDLSREVGILKSRVEEFALRFPTDEQNSNASTQPGRLILETKELLETLETRLQKFKSLATNQQSFSDKLRFERSTKKLRERLKNLASLIQGHQVDAILQQTDRISVQVAQIFDEVVNDKIVDKTIGSTRWNDFFNEIYVALDKRSISMQDVKGNKKLIIDAIAKGFEEQKNTLPTNLSATRSDPPGTQDYEDDGQLSNTTLQCDFDNISATSRYPWDTPDLLGDELTSVPSADEEAELKASILRAVTKRLSLRTLGRSSDAHDGLPPDSPSAFRKDSIALFDNGSFRGARPSFDKASFERKTSASSAGDGDLPFLSQMATQSSSASRRNLSSTGPRRTSSSHSQPSKGFFSNFASGLGQSSWSVME